MNHLTSILIVLFLFSALLMSQDIEKIKNDSVVAESTKSALYLKSYNEKREWSDVHELIIDYTSMVSVNVFKDYKNPHMSITTNELIIDSLVNENRI